MVLKKKEFKVHVALRALVIIYVFKKECVSFFSLSYPSHVSMTENEAEMDGGVILNLCRGFQL